MEEDDDRWRVRAGAATREAAFRDGNLIGEQVIATQLRRQ
jgi:hypothetical protein